MSSSNPPFFNIATIIAHFCGFVKRFFYFSLYSKYHRAHSCTCVSIDTGAFGNCNNLTDVYYVGSEEEWKLITIGNDNYDLTNATIHYNYVPEE